MRIRLDQLIADSGLAPSRARARDMILRGLVRVDGERAQKPAKLVRADAVLDVDERAAALVSRSAVKLEAALDAFGFRPKDDICLDVGASTGGFTQVLLERGARHVFAVDVGRDQLHRKLRTDDRVTSLEALDARHLTADHVGERISAVVADVSFISLRRALGPALKLCAPEAWLAVLVKPQFEVGPDLVGKGGIVRDTKAIAQAVDDVVGWLEATDTWRTVGQIASPITGGDGNREYLIGAVRRKE